MYVDGLEIRDFIHSILRYSFSNSLSLDANKKTQICFDVEVKIAVLESHSRLYVLISIGFKTIHCEYLMASDLKWNQISVRVYNSN